MEEIAIIPNSVIEELQSTQNQILNLLKKQVSGISNDEELITVKEAAKITSLSELKVRQLVDDGTFKSKKFGRAIRIYRSSL